MSSPPHHSNPISVKRKLCKLIDWYQPTHVLIRKGAPGQEHRAVQAAAFSEAQHAFETSARLDPKLAPPRVELAKVYLRENRVDEAVSQLESARTLDPKNKAVYSQLAIAYRKQGKNGLSQKMLNSLKELNDQERDTLRQIRIVRQGPPQVQ